MKVFNFTLASDCANEQVVGEKVLYMGQENQRFISSQEQKTKI